MNNIFKKEDMVKIDETYHLETDGFRGVCLVQKGEKERTKKDGTKEMILVEDKTYHATLGQALNRYFNLAQKEVKDLEKILEKTEEVLTVLKNFEKKYKNW